jgi:2-polyprenyl-3-methyl-5-hydroxy-6-metoxy-1,4-benzoquinol methylase
MRTGVDDKRSYTYDDFVIPWMEKNKKGRVLDFGCGQGDYVKHLQALGYNIIGMELFRRLKGEDKLDIKSVNLMVDGLCRSIKKFGRFDAVLIDYVLNSVDTQQAEDDVLATIKSFCKTGGALFYSGRTAKVVEKRKNVDMHASMVRGVEALDENGLSAFFHHGQWFYQKYHWEADVRKFSAKHNFEILHYEEKPDHQFRVAAINTETTIDEGALTREFNMKMGVDGRTLNRHHDVINALKGIK